METPLPTKCLFAQHWPLPPRSLVPLQPDGPWRVGEVQHDPMDQLQETRSVNLSWSCWESLQWANPASSSALSRDNSTSTRRAQLEVSGHKEVSGAAAPLPHLGPGIESNSWSPCQSPNKHLIRISWELKTGFLSCFCHFILCVALAKSLPLIWPLRRERPGLDRSGSFLLCQAVHLPQPLPLSRMGKWPSEWAGISEADLSPFFSSEPVIDFPVVSI